MSPPCDSVLDIGSGEASFASQLATLPGAMRLKDQDRARYLAIGESDRATLKFIKP